jgi:hypothetical protein
LLFHRLPKEVIDALYQRADQLERRWSNAGLSIDFGDRMLDALSRFIDRHQLSDLGPKQAVRLLSLIWNRNARRDFARATGKPRLVSLSDGEISVPFEAVEDDSVIALSYQILLEKGFRPEVVLGFLIDLLEDDPQLVVVALERTYGYRLTLENLRRWRCRYFWRLKEVLRGHRSELGLGEIA